MLIANLQNVFNSTNALVSTSKQENSISKKFENRPQELTLVNDSLGNNAIAGINFGRFNKKPNDIVDFLFTSVETAGKEGNAVNTVDNLIRSEKELIQTMDSLPSVNELLPYQKNADILNLDNDKNYAIMSLNDENGENDFVFLGKNSSFNKQTQDFTIELITSGENKGNFIARKTYNKGKSTEAKRKITYNPDTKKIKEELTRTKDDAKIEIQRTPTKPIKIDYGFNNLAYKRIVLKENENKTKNKYEIIVDDWR